MNNVKVLSSFEQSRLIICSSRGRVQSSVLCIIYHLIFLLKYKTNINDTSHYLSVIQLSKC